MSYDNSNGDITFELDRAFLPQPEYDDEDEEEHQEIDPTLIVSRHDLMDIRIIDSKS